VPHRVREGFGGAVDHGHRNTIFLTRNRPGPRRPSCFCSSKEVDTEKRCGNSRSVLVLLVRESRMAVHIGIFNNQ
jgi:hypothetical protein